MKTTFVVYVAKIIGFQKQDVATPQARRTALIQGALESSDPGASENFKADKIGSKWSRFDLSLTMEAARISAFQRTSNHRRATQLKAFDPLFRKLNGAKTVHKTPSVRMVPNFSLKNGFFFNPFHLNFPDFFACGARPAGAKPPPLFCFLNKKPITTFQLQKCTDNPNLRLREQIQLKSWIWTRTSELSAHFCS